MHTEALSGGVAEFDAAVEARVCPFLNELGTTALGEMRTVYEQLDAGDFSALGDLAERLASAVEQKSANEQKAAEEQPQEKAEPEKANVPDITESVRAAAKEQTDATPLTPAVPVLSEQQTRWQLEEPSPAKPAEKILVAEQPVTANVLTPDLLAEASSRPEHVEDVSAVQADTALLQQQEVHAQIARTTETAQQELAEASPQPEETEFAAELEFADQSIEQSESPSEDLALTNLAVEATVAEEQSVLTTENTGWEQVLQSEPAEVYDDFSAALQSLLVPAEQAPVLDEGELAEPDAPALVMEATPEQPEPLPAIAVTVAERLTELEPETKKTVAPVLKEIVGMIQTVDILLSAEAPPAALEAAQAQLEALVVALFEHADIAYEPADVQKFVSLLLRTDFKPVQLQQVTPVDLEHDGTHEAKLHFDQIVSGLSDVEETAWQLLGKLVLLSTARHSSPQHEYELTAV